MKIIIIGPNVGMGGVERASSNIANGLKNAGHNVTYLALIPEPHFFELSTNYIEPTGFNERKMDFIKTIKYIRKNVKGIQPDHIIAFTKFYAALANLALLFSKFKIVITERSSPLYQWPKHIELFCKFSFGLKKLAGVISQTSIASDYHKKRYGKTKYTVIRNAVREIKLYPEIKRENIILAVGRFHDACKGFDLLIEAFNLLEDKSWRLVFAGGSENEGQYLLDLADADKVSRIDFLGKVTNMDELYAKAGVFVIPSRSEGFPNALAEAMVSGCCCISFDFIAGPRDIIQANITGIIVESGNVKLLAETIDKLISDSDLRTTLERNAKENSISMNDESIIKNYIDFLNK
jgi:glycosyltransferase involved in cell wall biosynthesis